MDNNEVQLLESSDYEVTDFKKVLDDGGYKKQPDEKMSSRTLRYHAEKQGVMTTMEELGYEEDDDFDELFDDDEDYGDGNQRRII